MLFDRVYCINLDRRPDLWRDFAGRLPPDWPWPLPQRFAAIDGRDVRTLPPWWSAGKGAWGCYQSHLQLIEQCLVEGVASVLLLEDDAACVPDFTRQALDFDRRLPPDWQCAYLGGQHLKHNEGRPRYARAGVYRPYNVNRTHAWALTRDGMRIVRDWLLRTDWERGHHIDHRLGRLHESGRLVTYCPDRWLIYQRGHHSTISGRETDDSTWRDAVDIAYPTVACVLGPFRSGTSAVAGLLQRLGVSMGRGWPAIPGNPGGTYEDHRLAQMCRRWFREPDLSEQHRGPFRRRKLRDWLASRPRALIGAKHPTLCLCVPQILRAWPDVRLIAVDRPAAESVASILARPRWGWSRQQAETGTARLIAARDQALAVSGRPVLRIAYHNLLADPAAAVDRLIEYLGLEPAEDQRREAIAWIDPALRTIPATSDHVAAG